MRPVGVSVPLVLWNKNQGNIRAARAEVAAAVLDVTRTQNALADRLATAHRTYAAAKARAERYKSAVIPKAEENLSFLRLQVEKGVVEPLKVFIAQRSVVEAKLEYNRAVGEAWRAAAEVSGLLLEEAWPQVGRPTAPAKTPGKLPETLPPMKEDKMDKNNEKEEKPDEPAKPNGKPPEPKETPAKE